LKDCPYAPGRDKRSDAAGGEERGPGGGGDGGRIFQGVDAILGVASCLTLGVAGLLKHAACAQVGDGVEHVEHEEGDEHGRAGNS